MPRFGPPHPTSWMPSVLPLPPGAEPQRRTTVVRLTGASGTALRRCFQPEGSVAEPSRKPGAPASEGAPQKHTPEAQRIEPQGEAADQSRPVAESAHSCSLSIVRSVGALCMAKLAEDGAEAAHASQPDDVAAGEFEAPCVSARESSWTRPLGLQCIPLPPDAAPAPTCSMGSLIFRSSR
jgi:hypothetical protein